MKKHKVLWIEDGAFAEMTNLSSPIYVSGKYDLVIAKDATEGLKYLSQSEKQFETVIVDIRLPPGSDPLFLKLFKEKGESRPAARLGLALLKRVLKQGSNNDIPKHHSDPARFGVFTVEGYGELKSDLQELRIEVYHQKGESNNKFKLRDIIEEIRKRNLIQRG
jgi:hypothetical protein